MFVEFTGLIVYACYLAFLLAGLGCFIAATSPLQQRRRRALRLTGTVLILIPCAVALSALRSH